MGFFDLFRKKKAPDMDDLWAQWEAGRLPAPYAQLMTYQSEVNNGGHSQYFFNTANGGDLKAEAAAVLSLLPEPLHSNLRQGYEAFAAQADIADDVNDALFESCDEVFYAHEQLVNSLLEAYANTIKR